MEPFTNFPNTFGVWDGIRNYLKINYMRLVIETEPFVPRKGSYSQLSSGGFVTNTLTSLHSTMCEKWHPNDCYATSMMSLVSLSFLCISVASAFQLDPKLHYTCHSINFKSLYQFINCNWLFNYGLLMQSECRDNDARRTRHRRTSSGFNSFSMPSPFATFAAFSHHVSAMSRWTSIVFYRSEYIASAAMEWKCT